MSKKAASFLIPPKNKKSLSTVRKKNTSSNTKSTLEDQHFLSMEAETKGATGGLPKDSGRERSQSISLRSGSIELAPRGVTPLRRQRGYSLRTFNLFSRKLENLIERKSNGEEISERFLREVYDKLKKAYYETENLHLEVLKNTPEDSTDSDDYLDTPTEQFFQLQEKMSEILPEASTTKSTKKPDVKPSQRFRVESESEDEAHRERKAETFMFRAMSVNFKARDHCKTFTGREVREYKAFRTNWSYCDKILTQQGRSDYEKFQELKTVLGDDALKLVVYLPDLDSSYERALGLLDEFFEDPQLAMQALIKDLESIPSMKNEYKEIKTFYTRLLSTYHSIQAMELQEDQLGTSLFINNILPKLNNPARREWAKLSARKKDLTSPLGHRCEISDLIKIIEEQLQIARLNPERSAGKNDVKSSNSPGRTVPKTFAMQQTSNSPTNGKITPCDLCSKTEHPTHKCPIYQEKSPADLFQIANQKRLCKLCLRGNHKTILCNLKEKLKCRICKKPHNTKLHLQNPPVKGNSFSVKRTQTKAILPTLRCMAIPLDCNGEPIMNRGLIADIFLDSGSQVSLITSDFANSLRLKGNSRQLQLQTLQGPSSTDSEEVNFMLVKLGEKISDQNSITITAFTHPEILTEDTILDVCLEKNPHLKDIPLATVNPRQEPLKIDILIGEPYYSQIVSGEKIKGEKDQPLAWNSSLGYFLAGAC